MTCMETKDLLSDLIDVRSGEMPCIGDSRLAENGMRAETEAHLASCPDCRAELAVLEAVGDVFADFNVGELPAQHFAEYGQIVRARLNRGSIIQMPLRANRASRWMKFAGAAAAAACLTFAVVHFMPAKSKQLSISPGTQVAAKPAPRTTWTPIPPSNTETRLKFMPPINGVLPATVQPRDFVFNPTEPKSILETLSNDELRYGCVILKENPLPGSNSLLGLALRTTRDKDRDLSNKDSLGLKIHDIEPDSVASEMGLRTNDLIVTFNGMGIDSGGPEDAVKFLTAVHHLGKGANVDIEFVRRDENGLAFHVRKGVLGDPHATRNAE